MTFKIIRTTLIVGIVSLFFMEKTFSTIDLNEAELQYLADHMTPIECRRLVAAAHFKTYLVPNALDEAERKISKDLPCIDLLNHWNSQEGEGKGETHEVLEHRLRQMEKYALADWLGRTVFHQLGKDLNRSIKGIQELVPKESTQELFIVGPTLVPIVENNDPTKWSPIDTLLYATVVGLILIIVFLCCNLCYRTLRSYKKNREKRQYATDTFEQPLIYETLDEFSSSESEDKFDVRNYSGSKALMYDGGTQYESEDEK